MNVEMVFSHDYLFDDFLLNATGVLSFHGQEIAVPPKELHVLATLLEGRGHLVHKNMIIDKVWGDNLVGDESLTRCIYSLRRLLRESKNNKYIETVYGKGYRFVKPVTMMQHPRQSPERCKFAIFPFRGIDEAEAVQLHSLLLDRLSQVQPIGMSLIPAMLTRNRSNAEDILSLCHQLDLSFYLSGEFRTQYNQRVLVLELVDAASQNLQWRETIKLDGFANWGERIEALATVLPQKMPAFGSDAAQSSSNEVLLSHVMARRCLRVRQRGDLNMALQYLQMGLVQDPLHLPSLISIAETWLALAMQGETWPEFAFAEARHALDKALSIAPNQPAAQGVMGWLLCLSQGDPQQAANWLRQAVSQPDAGVELHFYHALQLCSQGDMERSYQVLSTGLTRDAHYPPALMLKLWLLQALGRSDEAVAFGLDLAGQHTLTSGFYSVLAVVLLHCGQAAQARVYADLALSMSPASMPEQIHHALVRLDTEPESVSQSLLEWSDEAERRYRCPALLAVLAMALGKVSAAHALLALAEQQNCVWLPLVRVSPAMVAFVRKHPLHGGVR